MNTHITYRAASAAIWVGALPPHPRDIFSKRKMQASPVSEGKAT
jgi:hypothetical protein